MAIRFRCSHCNGLLSISSRKAGSLVTCPTCDQETLVPLEDAFETPVRDEVPELEFPPAAEASGSEADSEPEPDVDIVFGSYEGEPQSPAVEPPVEVLAPVVVPAPIVAPSVSAASQRGELQAAVAEESEPPFQFNSRRLVDEEEDMDLTPMVDVTFLLLIFFMVTASFSLQKSIETPTPQPDQQGAAQSLLNLEDLQGTSILVKIDAANTLTLDDEPWPDLGRLAEALRDKMRREQKTEVIITADSAALHRTVVTVIDAANDAGIQKIRLGSRKG
jgi:biopolymer transport protein ExbD